MLDGNGISNSLTKLSRKNFLKYCSIAAATLGLPPSMAKVIAAEVSKKDTRPPVIWLHFQECTGCTESLLRATHPEIGELILDLVSLDYHETLMAAAGKQAHEALKEAMKKNKGKYVLVVEGAIPTKNDGKYCMIGGQTAKDMLTEVAGGAAAIIAIGSCASWGGVPSAKPNPTGAVGAGEILKGKTVLTLPGCPPSPYNFLSAVMYLLTFKKLPKLDKKARPLFAYGRTIHDHCERRSHFDAGRFVKKYGDEGHQKGYCMYVMGCKGPRTYANCPAVGFNDLSIWPVKAGHPCVGCTEKEIAFEVSLYKSPKILPSQAPKCLDMRLVETFPDPAVEKEKGGGSMVGAAIAGAAIGAIAGYAGAVAGKLPSKEDSENE